MKIDDWYPKPHDFLKCELQTLKFLKDKPIIQQNFPILYNDAYRYYFNIQNGKGLAFNFETQFEIQVDGRAGIAYIGALIMIKNENRYDGISYYIAICENNSSKSRLIRKYHFDYALYDPSRRQPHPVFHLQYAGKMSDYLKNQNLEYEHIDSWLSEPRLFYIPMSLALVVNMVLKEFPNEINLKVIELSEWRDLVRKNENLLLAPYYKRCHNFLENRDPSQLFINDFYYGN